MRWMYDEKRGYGTMGDGARCKLITSLLAIVAVAYALLACTLAACARSDTASASKADGAVVLASASESGAYRDRSAYDLLGSAACQTPQAAADPQALPAFDGVHATVEVNAGVPGFSTELLGCTESFEAYAPLDERGRCGAALACIGPDLLCDEERGSIGTVKPSGWHTAKYEGIDGKYLYNRCHLIAFMLAGENANELNLITGTRFLNVQGMLPYETLVHDYVAQTGNHVLYRATPLFEGDNLLASGVQLEGWSVEDGGAGVRFNVYAYNCQPGVLIDYATGASEADPGAAKPAQTNTGENGPSGEADAAEPTALEASGGKPSSNDDPSYILNTNTRKFHYPWCASVDDMSEKNKREFFGTADEAQEMGYEPCKRCNP